MPDRIRLYLDEDTMSRALLRALRSRSVDVLTAQEAGMIQSTDAQHLAYATSLDRVVFTFNVRDFARLHNEHMAAGQHHTGIIVSDQLQTGIVVRRLLRLIAMRTAAALCDSLEYLGNWR